MTKQKINNMIIRSIIGGAKGGVVGEPSPHLRRSSVPYPTINTHYCKKAYHPIECSVFEPIF
jgi:hypothetical protein